MFQHKVCFYDALAVETLSQLLFHISRRLHLVDHLESFQIKVTGFFIVEREVSKVVEE